jgi:hypothetical protein
VTRACLFGALFSLACAAEDVRLGDGPLRAGGEGGPDAAPVLPDAAPVLPDASNGGVPSFGTPHVIASLSDDTTHDDDPSLTSDLTEIYFDSKRDGGKGKEDIWSAKRASATAAWDPPVVVEELNSEERETGIALSADGLTIWFSSERPESQGGLDVFTATRKNRSSSWSAVTRVEELSTPDDDLVSAVSDSGTVCMLSRRPKGTDEYDIFAATRGTVDGAWEAPQPLSELNTDSNESDAFLVGEGRELLFTRSKDLQLARRAGTIGPFTLIGPLEELNSSSEDTDPWATPDLRYVVFSSDRSGSSQLYEASR